MGTIDPRLEKAFQMVREGVALPLIIEVQQPSDALKKEFESRGLRGARIQQNLPFIYGMGTTAVARAIAGISSVVRVSYDEPVYTRAVLPFELVRLTQKVVIPLGDTITETGAPKLWEQGYTGKGVKIAVIDTGVSQSHDMIRNALRGSYSAVKGEDVEDMQSHGSWCASAACGRKVLFDKGYAIGAAPEADLYALKALDRTGAGQMSWVMDCIQKATNDFKVDIISMSLGSLFDNGGLDPVSRTVNHVVTEHGVIAVIAAGNSFGPMTIGSPGGAVTALTVAAYALKVPTRGSPSTFSSKGPTSTLVMKPDIAAPGGNIVSPGTGELITGAAAHGGFANMAGTSMATPQVAGCMALLKQARPGLSRAEVEQLLLMSLRPKDTVMGYGPIRVDRLYQNIDKPSTSTAQFINDIARLQVLPYVPFTLLPHPDTQSSQEIRLPAFVG